MFSVNGLQKVHLENQRAARHLRPDFDTFGPGRVMVGHHLLVIRIVPHGEERRPGERPTDLALQFEHFIVRDHPTREECHHAARSMAQWLEEGAQFLQVADA